MSSLPPDSLRPLAARMAQALWALDNARLRTLFDELARSVPETTAASNAAVGRPKVSSPDRIGIWGRENGDPKAPYRRVGGFNERRLWAAVDEISATAKGRRIVLLGESVARGFFYDPVFTPAVVLQDLLRKVPGLGDLEVVDLARSDINLEAIAQLGEQSVRLQPAIFVIFAGNNLGWPMRSPHRALREEFADAVALHGFRGYIERIAHWRAGRAERFMKRMARVARKAGAQVIVVVPEFNLVDWREDLAWLVPILEGDRNRRWHEVAGQARSALASGMTADAAKLAAALVDLDQGASPVGLAILGRCHLLEGRTQKARELLEAARDVRRALFLRATPGCSSVNQKALRASGEQFGFHVVDMPRLVQERLDGQLPDRRVFMDYCHLTSEGIRIAIQAVGEIAAPLLGAVQPFDWRGAMGDLQVPAAVEADAHFMAAIHCAGWQQSDELVQFHCSEAARLKPPIADKMALYLDAFGRAGAGWLKRSFIELAGAEHSPTYRYFCELLPLVDNSRYRTTPFVRALEKASLAIRRSEVPPDTSANPPLTSSSRRIDLLLPRCAVDDRIDGATYSRRPRIYFESYEPLSRFTVLLERDGTFRLQITYRTPDAETGHEVAFLVNGSRKAKFQATHAWTSVEVADLVLKSGHNDLAIDWPTTDASSGDRIKRAAEQLRSAGRLESMPIYGQCYRLRLVAQTAS